MTATPYDPGHDLGHDDVEQLIVDFQKSGLRELHVRHDGLEVYLSTDPAAAGIGQVVAHGTAPDRTPASTAPAAETPASVASPQAAAASAAPPAALPPGGVVVKAPYLGTFYRSPKPGAPAFVEIGQMVAEDTELCLVEVMKLFTAVRAGTAGSVHRVLASDGEMVAADQPLFVIVPA